MDFGVVKDPSSPHPMDCTMVRRIRKSVQEFFFNSCRRVRWCKKRMEAGAIVSEKIFPVSEKKEGKCNLFYLHQEERNK